MEIIIVLVAIFLFLELKFVKDFIKLKIIKDRNKNLKDNIKKHETRTGALENDRINERP